MFRVNIERFDMVFGRIFQAYVEENYLAASFRSETSAPQILHVPKGIKSQSFDHARFLTMVAWSDKRTDSMLLYRNFARMFSENPWLLEVGTFPTEREVGELFKRYKIALMNRERGDFALRKQHLDIVFGGDPFAVYDGVRTVDELERRLEVLRKEWEKEWGMEGKLLPNVGSKIHSLLGMFLWEQFGIDFVDVVPVDTWVQSIANATGCLEGEGLADPVALEKLLRPHISRVFMPYRKQPGASNATFILGSKLCKVCTRTNTENLCPVWKECGGPTVRYRHPESGKHLARVMRPPRFLGKCTTPVLDF